MTNEEAIDILRILVTHYNLFGSITEALCKGIEAIEQVEKLEAQKEEEKNV